MKEMKFDVNARNRFIRNILCEMKSELDAEQDFFDVTFEKMTYLKNGFGYKFKLSRKDPDGEMTASFIEAYYVLHNYVQNMFNYLFNGKVRVSSFSDDNAFEMEFEIVSDF